MSHSTQYSMQFVSSRPTSTRPRLEGNNANRRMFASIQSTLRSGTGEIICRGIEIEKHLTRNFSTQNSIPIISVIIYYCRLEVGRSSPEQNRASAQKKGIHAIGKYFQRILLFKMLLHFTNGLSIMMNYFFQVLKSVDEIIAQLTDLEKRGEHSTGQISKLMSQMLSREL